MRMRRRSTSGRNVEADGNCSQYLAKNCCKEGAMSEMSRREFVKNAATHAAAAGFISAGGLELRANPLGMPIGCQTWPVREMIAKDFPGTIKQLADAGFQTVELCSPGGYSDYGFPRLGKYTGTELRRILGETGVACVSSHFGIKELRDDQEGRIAWAKNAGFTQMIWPPVGGPKKPNLNDVRGRAQHGSKLGGRCDMTAT